MKRKIYAFVGLLVIISTILTSTLSASAAFVDEDLSAKLYSEFYIVQNLDDGSIVLEQDSDVQTPAAGFIKVVAGIVACESWSDLSEEVYISALSLSLVDYNYGVTTAGLEVGTTIKKSELLDYLLIYGANDALSVIAYYVSGGFTDFIAQMNETVQSIGCENTNIVNMTGFDINGQYTTAADVCKIMTLAMNYSYVIECMSKTSMVVGTDSSGDDITYNSTNKMMTSTVEDYYHSAVTFGKQTSTDEAGQCIAVHTTQDGYSYMVVVMKGDYVNIDDDTALENTCMTDAQALINWVYDNLKFKVVAEAGQVIYTIDVSGSADSKTLQLIASSEVTALVPSRTTSASVLITPQEDTLPDYVEAPIEQGDYVCMASVMYAGVEILEIELVAATSLNYSLSQVILSKISSFVGSWAFLISSGICLLITMAFLAITIYNIEKRKNSEKSKIRTSENMKKYRKEIDRSHLKK